MEMDVQPDKHFWTRPKIQEADTPLTIWHLLLPFIFLASALVLSMMTFCIEKNGRKIGHNLRVWLRLLTRARHVKIQPELGTVTVSPVMAVMVKSPVTKSSPVTSPVTKLSPVKHFHR